MSHTQSVEDKGEASVARFRAAALGWAGTFSNDRYAMVEGTRIRPAATP